MRNGLFMPGLVMVVLVMVGCESKPEPAAPTAESAAPSDESTSAPIADAVGSTVKAVAGAKTVQAGCGMCIFKMDGVKSCQLAVKVDGKPYLVTGSDVNAHEAGLCDKAIDAEVVGDVEGDKFAVTAFTLKP
jgi:hypothetical protein